MKPDPLPAGPESADSARPSPPRWRIWLYRLAAMTLLPSLVLGGLELGLRAVGYGFPTAFFLRHADPDVFVTNPRFGWRFFPRAVARNPLVESVPASKPPGTIRIFVLGGSAAQGYPDPAFGFGRMLRYLLEQARPDLRFEVVNAAMIAINSHAVRPIAEDCADLEPDRFVVYLGNNEVVGPFGPGTVFADFSPDLGTIRASLWVQTTRIGQALGDAFGLVSTRMGRIKVWRGMEMFLDRVVAADDPRLERVRAHLRANLVDVCRAGRASGAGVLLCTVATNLRDCAPFASVHRAGLTDETRAEWERAYRAGIEHEAAGRWREALERYGEAASLDYAFAELEYRRGRCLRALGDHEAARPHFVRARDLDALRFRADTGINRVIRDVAQALATEGVQLIDAERAFETSPLTTAGTPGAELFHEHVHMNFAGNLELARAVAAGLLGGLPRPPQSAPSPAAAPPTAEQCAAALAFTRWDERSVERSLLELTGSPPFVNQLDHAARHAERVSRIEALDRALDAAALADARRVHERAVAARPDDPVLRMNLAKLLGELGDHAGAARELEQLLARHPVHWKAWNRLGTEMAALGRHAEAETDYRRALDLDPVFLEAHNNLGLLAASRGDLETAVEHYRRGLAAKPNDAAVYYNLGTALRALGRTDEAMEAYRRTLEFKPEFFRAHNNLANLLQLAGRLDEAIAHYRKAIEIEPDYGTAHHNLGVALLAEGRVGEAIPHLERAVEIDPRDTAARESLKKARLAEGR